MNRFDSSPLRTGIVAGLAGAIGIDLYLIVTETLVIRNATPLLVMQWDASNALGMAAFDEGWASAVLGTLMHFAVSVAWGTLFVAVALRLRRLLEYPWLSGALLGIVAMGVMRAVIHLGRAPIHPFPNAGYFLNILIAHVLFFGIPVALTAAALLRPGKIGRAFPT
jgi:hypothetical protein